MPELPEIYCRAQEMDEHLSGRTIRSLEVLQPKCLNVSRDAFEEALVGATLKRTTYHGKWLFTETSQGYLLVNLGMGGEILLVSRDRLPEKWRVRFDFDADESLAINFWWFGNTHYVPTGALSDHALTAKLGPNAIDLTQDEFRASLEKRRGGIKSFLLDQKKIAGIGNAYVHDILYRAGLHPLRAIPSLDADDIARLHHSIQEEFARSISKGAASYELNLFGERGRFGANDLLVGYREGRACPNCGAGIEKLKTGATTSYICPSCQSV